jgi:UDP-N-acetylglucosamine 2-epimerase
VRIVTVVGARPQFIKAAPISRLLRASHHEMLIHTGQHYDDAMSASFFRELSMPDPDANLEIGSAAHGAQTAEMLKALEPMLVEHEPDGVLVYGDTNSTLAGALAAAKVEYGGGRRPWLAHVEAGLRSFNRAMPEERNRVVTDHLADLLLAPTPTAMAQLRAEGLDDRAELVGDVMADAVCWAADQADLHLPAAAAEQPGFLLMTLHRAENVDDPGRLAAWLAMLPDDRPVIWPMHPRTTAALARADARPGSNVTVIEPVGYLAMLAMERAAVAVATDSGGVQKEAYLAGVPCITLRTETEWVETVEAGWNRVTGHDPNAVRLALADTGFMDRSRPRPPLFGDGHAAERVVAALERLGASHSQDGVAS